MAPPSPAPDFAAARDHMVDGQVRPNKVVDPRIIRAMRTLPRERFLPPHLASLAYVDEDVALPGGRALVEPMVIARLVQLLQVRAGESGLVVGAGTGYGAALLATMGARVTALEDDPALLAIARAALAGTAVTIVDAPVAAGWPGAAPYDFILIDGAVSAIPDALADQLSPTGRLATVVQEAGNGGGQGVLAEPVQTPGHHPGAPGRPAHRLRAQPFFDCTTPLLPQLRARPAFTF